MFDECVSGRSYIERCGRSKRGDRFCTLISANFSIPNNLTRFCAESLWHAVTKVKLRIEDEEAGWVREIACPNDAGEEMVRVYVDRERLGLKNYLEHTIEDREGQVDDGNS